MVANKVKLSLHTCPMGAEISSVVESKDMELLFDNFLRENVEDYDNLLQEEVERVKKEQRNEELQR